MRKIKLETWKVKDQEGNEKDEDLLVALSVLIANKDPKEMPRGIDKHRLFNRIANAFEKAEKTRVLELEEADYSFLKETVEKDIPAIWGMNKNISKAIEDFLAAKNE